MSKAFKNLTSKKYIDLKGVRTHNLKNISIRLPHNQLIVVTGLSGSGKSSLAFDTLFAEGQRRYMESLSTYIRQFFKKIEKPPVDYIKGILPSIGLRQKARTHNPRSRVSTSADIYPYLKLLYARIGITYSPISGKVVQKDTIEDVVNYVQKQSQGSKVQLLAPLYLEQERTFIQTLKIELSKGFTRIMFKDEIHLIEDLICTTKKELPTKDCYLIIDRLVMPSITDTSLVARIAESAQRAFFEGKNSCIVTVEGKQKRTFSNLFEADGIKFVPPTPHFFSFGSAYGACKNCGGSGTCIAPKKVIPNKTLSVAEGAISPYKDLPPQQALYRLLQARYHVTTCKACRSTGLREDTAYVKVGGKSLIDLLCMPIVTLKKFFNQLQLTQHQQQTAKVLIEEIKSRLDYLQNVGLSYLTLHRPTSTLSDGEYQRIRLAKALGSTLVNILYVLDEPTKALHARDIHQLVQVFVQLKKAGNTVVVVGHEEALMRIADQIIDIGPGAGAKGGQIVFQGKMKDLLQEERSHTARYLTRKAKIAQPRECRKPKHTITLQGAYENNLKDITVNIPLEVFTVVTGVSGSGKSTLIQKVLYPALCHYIGQHSSHTANSNISGDLSKIKHIEQISANSLGKSVRSNLATYLNTYDLIRRLFSTLPLAIERAYTPAYFSFNIQGGRCQVCLGTGYKKVDMQFLADVVITCPSCKGKRFKQEVLEVLFSGKNIAQVLDMTIDESLVFFKNYPSIKNKLQPLEELGMGYIKLGQPSSTFSGGEAQRIKLSTYLSKDSQEPTLFIFDEPTTGLHFFDISKLMKILQRLVDKGHTVLVIEHNIEVIKCADWVIDMGPEGGEQGGKIVFEGTPKQLSQIKNNHTAHYLRKSYKDLPI